MKGEELAHSIKQHHAQPWHYQSYCALIFSTLLLWSKTENIRFNIKPNLQHYASIRQLSRNVHVDWNAKQGLHRERSTRKLSWRKGYARQQCVYEGPYGKNLSSAGNPTLEPPNVTSMTNRLRSYGHFVYPRWPSAAILDFNEPKIAPFDPPTPKTLA